MMRRLAALLFLVGCTKATPPGATTDAGVEGGIVVAVDAAPALSPDDDVRRVVRAWSDALDRHDVDALGALYADNVFFYTSVRTKAQVLAAKKSALGSTSTFHQQIVGDVAVTNGRATFTKRSGNGTKLASSDAVLVVAGSPLVITEERDAPQPRDVGSCEAAVMGVVEAIPAVKKELEAIQKNVAKAPDLHMGGIGPEREDDGTIDGQLGVHHPDRFESVVQFSYSAKGALSVSLMGDEYTSDAKAASDKAHLITDTSRLAPACGH